jgi:hypothetical protein
VSASEALAPAPVVPRYGSDALCDVVPSLAASLGVDGWENVLGVPEASRWVLLLVDGLGDLNLAEAVEEAPFLGGLRTTGGQLTAGVPSTTATSITSLGTGLTPGQHGMLGYSFRNPVGGGLLNALLWQDGLSAYDIQPRLTAFERLARSGVTLTSVSPARFAGTGLTEAALRGARFQPVPDETDDDARIGWTIDAAASGSRSLVYLYERSLDHTGHGQGWRTDAWRSALRRIDRLAARLRDSLPDDTRLLITGDHGMVDAPQQRWVIVEDVPGLGNDLTLFAGEGRLRQLYAEQRHVAAVKRRWAAAMGERAWVLTRDEAIDAGWFGTMDPRMGPRIGDVLVAMRDDGAVMTRSQPREFGLVGMHGSLTELETRVPLLVA